MKSHEFKKQPFRKVELADIFHPIKGYTFYIKHTNIPIRLLEGYVDGMTGQLRLTCKVNLTSSEDVRKVSPYFEKLGPYFGVYRGLITDINSLSFIPVPDTKLGKLLYAD
jgi:hypothetical protein